jgi:hypothetical protein
VTIAAGFRFNGGVIICADTQETIAHSKTSVPKLRLEPSMMVGRDSPDDLMIAMAGAGDGPFIDKLVERAWEGASPARSFAEACSKIETSIKETHQEYGQIFQLGYLPGAELIYGVKMHGDSKLFGSQGPIVNEKHSYGSVGAGYYMADFLASRMHQRYLPGPDAVILAAYVLFQCKEHVDGCGGESHIVALNETGDSRFVDPWRVDFATQQLQVTDGLISRLLLSAPDYSVADAQFKKELQSISAMIESIRYAGRRTSDAHEQYLAEIKDSQEILRHAFETNAEEERKRKAQRASSQDSDSTP